MWLGQLFDHSKKKKKGQIRAPFAVVTLLVAVSALVLTPLAYLGFFSRYLADDYCFSRQVIEHGFWGAQVNSYLTWSDRFSSTFVNTLSHYAGPVGMQWLAVILIVLLTLGSILILRKIRFLSGIPLLNTELFALSALCVYISLYSAPDLFQSLYWRAGSITYTLPLAFLMGGLLLVISRLALKPTIWMSALIVVVFVVAGGFSETNLALQTMVVLILMAGVAIRTRRIDFRQTIWVHLAAALAGSLAALIILLLSPGNAVRMENMPARPDFITWIWLSIRFALGYFYQTLTAYPAPIVVTGILCFCLALQKPWLLPDTSKITWLFWAIPASLVLMVTAICAPSAYVQSAYPENRALIGARLSTVIAVGSWFYLAGVWVVNRLQAGKNFDQIKLAKNAGFALVMVSFYLVYGGLQLLSIVPERRAWANEWDRRADQIEQAVGQGEKDVQVTALDSVERLKELDDDPGHWVNKCAAVYYGVDRISAK